MKTIEKTSILFLAVIIGACSAQTEQSETLMHANKLHLEAAQIHHRLAEQLDSAKAIVSDSVHIKMLDSLSNVVGLWEESTVEVPGFEHEHDHSGKHHHHKPTQSMTDASMLEYQSNANLAIKELAKAFDELNL